MASQTTTIKVNATLSFDNPKAIRALKVIMKELRECEDIAAWRPGIKRAIKAAKYAVDHIKVS